MMRTLIALVGLAAVGCGGGDAPIALDAGACSLPVIYQPSCSKCMETECCAEATACNSDAQCQTFVACASRCGMDQSCLFACEPNGSTMTPSYMLLACVSAHCRAICGG